MLVRSCCPQLTAAALYGTSWSRMQWQSSNWLDHRTTESQLCVTMATMYGLPVEMAVCVHTRCYDLSPMLMLCCLPSVCVCMCACVYVCMCVRMCVCVYVCTYVCMCVCVYVCTYVCMCVRTVCVYVCMCACVYVCMCVLACRCVNCTCIHCVPLFVVLVLLQLFDWLVCIVPVWAWIVLTYSRFRVFSPDCTLHSAITHVIKVWERRRLTWIPIAQSCVGVRRSNTKITWVIAKVQCAIGTKNPETTVTLVACNIKRWYTNRVQMKWKG